MSSGKLVFDANLEAKGVAGLAVTLITRTKSAD